MTEEADLDSATSNLSTIILQAFNKHAPLKYSQQGRPTLLPKPIRTEIKKREEYYRKARASRSPEDVKAFRQQRTRVIKMIRGKEKKTTEHNLSTQKSAWTMYKKNHQQKPTRWTTSHDKRGNN